MTQQSSASPERLRPGTFLGRHPYVPILLVILGLLTLLSVNCISSIFFTGLPRSQTYSGVVLDEQTGLPIAGIEVKVKWALEDYPMLDGAGTYYVEVSATTAADGKFVLPAPRHRRGLWSNEFEGMRIESDFKSPHIGFFSRYPGDYEEIRLAKNAFAAPRTQP